MEHVRGIGFAAELIAFAACLSLATPSWAEEGPRPESAERSAAESEAEPAGRDRGREWHLGLEVATDLPVAIGGQLTLEIPYGFRLSTAVGALPTYYVDLINSAVVAAGGYDDNSARLVSTILERTLVWKIQVGWRPFGDHGFYLAVGYGRMSARGGEITAETIADVIGEPLPARVPNDSALRIESTLHMVDVELGWEFVIAGHLTLRFALGAMLTVGSETEITVEGPLQDHQLVQAYRGTAADYIDNIFRSYAFIPTASMALGFRFF